MLGRRMPSISIPASLIELSFDRTDSRLSRVSASSLFLPAIYSVPSGWLCRGRTVVGRVAYVTRGNGMSALGLLLFTPALGWRSSYPAYLSATAPTLCLTIHFSSSPSLSSTSTQHFEVIRRQTGLLKHKATSLRGSFRTSLTLLHIRLQSLFRPHYVTRQRHVTSMQSEDHSEVHQEELSVNSEISRLERNVGYYNKLLCSLFWSVPST